MHEKFRKLIELGAGDFEQADTQLIAHLEGTCCLLKAWNAPEELQLAGLYYVAYGTSVINDNMFDLSKRQEIAEVIGEKPEHIVYHYFACDKERFFAQFAQVKHPIFYDRFTDKPSSISTELFAQLCELFAAKEIDLAIYNHEYAAKHAKKLVALFSRMRDFLSSGAIRKINYVFSAKV